MVTAARVRLFRYFPTDVNIASMLIKCTKTKYIYSYVPGAMLYMLPKRLMAPSRKLNFIDDNSHLTKYFQDGQNREAVSIRAHGAGSLELVRMRTFITVNRVGSASHTWVEIEKSGLNGDILHRCVWTC